MVNFIQENYQAFLGILASAFAYFGGRKLKKAEETQTTEEIAEQEKQQKQELKRQAHKELLKTDWYVVRFVERGIAIPKEILEQRELIRNSI
jgi:hypothetical protein